MPDIAVTTQFQKCQISDLEASWGDLTARTIALGSIDLSPTPKRGAQTFTPKGVLLPTVVASGEEGIEIGIDGKATYEELNYVVSDVVSDAATDPIPSRSVECGGLLVLGAVIDNWSIKGNPSEVTISGGMFGKSYSVAAATPGLTIPALTPILNKHVSFSIGGTPIIDAFEWSLTVNNLWAPAYYVGAATPGRAVQRLVDAKFNVSFEATADNLDLISEEDLKAIVITMTDGANTATITFDGRLEEPEAFSDHDGVYGYGLNYVVMNKATKAIEVAVS